MKAIVIEQFGGVETLVMKELDIPAIHEGEVLVKTKAIGINPVDCKARHGKAMIGKAVAEQLTLPIILGWDICGEVVQVNSQSRFKVGDTVFGMVRFPGEGKTYAEYVAVPEAHVVHKPENISDAEAGAIPLAGLTAYQALVRVGKITQGSRVFIQGASGGVGHLAVQIAKAMGAYVIGTASEKNRDFVLGLGADECIDYTSAQVGGRVEGGTEDRAEEFAQNIDAPIINAQNINIQNIDVALDCVGGDVARRTIRVVKDGGMIISLPSPFDETLGSMNPAVATPRMLVHSDLQDMRAIADLIKAEKLKVHIHKTFGFDNMRLAHEQLENGKTIGKIVVVFD